MHVIDPRGMGVVEWANAMALELQPFGPVPRLEDPKLWRDWARSVMHNPQIASRVPPEPRFFDDWQDWAIRFIQTLQGLGT